VCMEFVSMREACQTASTQILSGKSQGMSAANRSFYKR
jgi:hypothetical protein